MRAGFSRINITPPMGTRMMGFGARDIDGGCQSVRDAIYVRALYLEHGSQEALIMSFDLCFLGRDDSDRLKGALGRELELLPRQILLNASHSHVGPAVGTWGYFDYLPADQLYLQELQVAVLRAAVEAKARAQEATLWAGQGRSVIPMSRRRRWTNGKIENRPNPGGTVDDALPVVAIKDAFQRPVALLFSIGAHPSIMSGFSISAEYPGMAMRILDQYLDATGAMFLQGCGGDVKTSVAGVGRDTWHSDDWDVVERVGATVAAEVIALLQSGLRPVEPNLATAMLDMNWPLGAALPRGELESLAASEKSAERLFEDRQMRALWARRQLELVRRGRPPVTATPVLLQGIALGAGLRMIACEGEPVADHGLAIRNHFADGVCFALGYSNGQAMYLPSSRQIPEGGYEVDSFWEYGFPSQLAPGMERILEDALNALHSQGIT